MDKRPDANRIDPAPAENPVPKRTASGVTRPVTSDDHPAHQPLRRDADGKPVDPRLQHEIREIEAKEQARTQKEKLTKDDVEAQIRAHEQRMKARMQTLEHEATRAEQELRVQAATWKEKIQDNLGRIGAGVGVLVLGKMLFGGSSFDPADVPQRTLDDSYVDALSRRVAARLDEGESLRTALADTLREKSPVILREPQSGSSFWSRLLTIGALAGAAYGLNRLAQQQTGRNIPDWVRAKVDEQTSDDAGRAYPPVHGTRGATMPNPERQAAARPTTDTSAFATGTTPKARSTETWSSEERTDPTASTQPSKTIGRASTGEPSTGGSAERTTVQGTAGGAMPDPDRKSAAEKLRAADTKTAGAGGSLLAKADADEKPGSAERERATSKTSDDETPAKGTVSIHSADDDKPARRTEGERGATGRSRDYNTPSMKDQEVYRKDDDA